MAAALTVGLVTTGVLMGTAAQARPNSNTTTIFGFAGGSPWLTTAMKATTVTFAKTNQYSHTVTCTGYTSGPKGQAKDVILARNRATNVCAIIKANSPVAVTTTIKYVNTNDYGPNVRRVVVTFDQVPG
jgi:hypothetical protein